MKKFSKVLMIGIDETKLDAGYWKRIDSLSTEKIRLPKDSTKIREALADAAACLQVLA